MKNLILLVLVIAGFVYFERSCTTTEEKVASGHSEAQSSRGGGPVREWEQAPNAVADMQGALGGSAGGPANAARDAIRDQVSH